MAKTIACPRCRKTLREGARFCTGCGLPTAQIVAGTDESAPRATAEDEGRRTSDPLVGRVLDSKYELLARLGEGGMGSVYRARRLHIGDEVAVKVLHQRLLLDESAVERFRREARSAAMIGHPNVVTIHDFSEERADGTPAYIVMELVRGESLRDLLKREGRLPQERAAALMRGVCAGVGLAHRQGVVHRDLKPDNVIVVPPSVEGEDEVAKVVDFGIAKLRDLTAPLTLTQTGAVMGTPFYMPPEQCRGEHLDARADVYSLGAMLYEMLTGAPPFRAANLANLIAKQLSEAPPPFPADLHLSPALEAVCMRALSKEPDGRQADASALWGEIRAALAAPAPAGPQPPAPVSGFKTVRAEYLPTPTARPQPTQTRRAVWAVAGLFVILLGATIAASLVWYMRSDDTGRPAESADATRAVNTAATASLADPTPTENIESATNAKPENLSSAKGSQDLTGEWKGTYGPLGQPATLTIKESKGGKLSGVLEQSGVRVAFVGSVDFSTRQVTMKETQVLSGSGWNLGENTGTISADLKEMSGTGSDAFGAQLGISYPWSFSKR